MKLRLFLAGLMIVSFTSTAMAASGPYVSASGGLSVFHDNDAEIAGVASNASVSYKTGYGFNAAAGYRMNDFRLEAEFGYKKADLKNITHPLITGTFINSDQTVMSYMLNGYYDINLDVPSFTPFVGAGLGLLNGEVNLNGIKRDDNVLGFQFTAGGSYNINKNVSLDLYYRYQGASYAFDLDGLKLSYGSSNINGGIRYHF